MEDSEDRIIVTINPPVLDIHYVNAPMEAYSDKISTFYQSQVIQNQEIIYYMKDSSGVMLKYLQEEVPKTQSIISMNDFRDYSSTAINIPITNINMIFIY